MNLAMWTLLGAGLVAGQPPEDYRAHRSRGLRLDLEPIEAADRPKIRQIELHVSEDQGGVWNVESVIKPDQPYLAFQAKKDGAYWLKLVTVFTDGTTDPENIATAPPLQKILIDTVAPQVRLSTVERQSDEVMLSWSVEDRFPDDAKTRVDYRPLGGSDAEWKLVPITGVDKRSTRFKPQTSAAVQVRVTVEDAAGNTGTALKDLPSLRTSAFQPPSEVSPVAATSPFAPTAAASTTPIGTKPPASSTLIVPSMLPSPTLGAATPPPSLPGPPAPVMDLTFEETRPAPIPAQAPTPIATGAGVNPLPSPVAAAAPTPVSGSGPQSLPAVQPINFMQFDLPYQIDAGPSGVSRVDLYLTRDDGRSWIKWSEHNGKESPLKVNLESRSNGQREGIYGLRLVAISGAGLSDSAPTPGTPPDFRVEVDETPPLIQIFTPEADPGHRDLLILKWAVKDKNVGNQPISMEWSESANGPWRSVSGGDGDILAAGGSSTQANRIPNTGTFGWRIPANLPSHRVHLRMMAWDLAGNKSEVVTPPVLVDLTKPRARIQGVVPSQMQTSKSP